MKNITYIDAINAALTADLSTEVKDKLTALKEQLVKRNASKSNKPTKTQRENAEIKAQIKDFLTHTLQGLKCGDVATELGISGQKASALLSQMVTAGEVVKRMDKRTALFLLPENDMSDPANS
jgi:hypothetical protein